MLVADGGGTKVAWRAQWVGADGTIRKHAMRTNPVHPVYTQPKDAVELVSSVASEFKERGLDAVQTVHFYGSGTDTESCRLVVYRWLLEQFPSASIAVENDIVAVARALCGDAPGVVAILGTGTNVGFYDGKAVQFRQRSFGWLFDRGSGVAMGSKILSDFASGSQPPAVFRCVQAWADATAKGDGAAFGCIGDDPTAIIHEGSPSGNSATAAAASDVVGTTATASSSPTPSPLASPLPAPAICYGSGIPSASTTDALLERAYQQSNPAQYIASVVRAVFEGGDSCRAYLRGVVTAELELFVENLCGGRRSTAEGLSGGEGSEVEHGGGGGGVRPCGGRYPEARSVGLFVGGSIAEVFREELAAACAACGVELKAAMGSVLDGVVRYHAARSGM